jgi:hypothetical protein
MGDSLELPRPCQQKCSNFHPFSQDWRVYVYIYLKVKGAMENDKNPQRGRSSPCKLSDMINLSYGSINL